MKRSPLLKRPDTYKIYYLSDRPVGPPPDGDLNVPIAAIHLSTHDLYSWYGPDRKWFQADSTSIMASIVIAQVLGLPEGMEPTADDKRRYWHILERKAGRGEKLR